MKNLSVILSILALLAAVAGLALALAAFFRRHGFCCCDDDDLEDYYYDEDDDCCCDEGPIRIHDGGDQPAEDAPAQEGSDNDELSF